MSRRAVAIAGLALLLAGCAGRAPRPPEFEAGPSGAKALVETWSARPCPDRIAGECEMRVTPAGGRTVRLYGSFRAAWPERMRLQVRFGPFMPVASIAVDPDSTTLSLPRQKAYWSGPATGGTGPAGITGGLALLLCPSPLIGSITGPVLEAAGEDWILRGNGKVGGRESIVSVRLDRSGKVVREVLVMDLRGRALVRALREGRLSVGGVTLPRRIRLDLSDPPGTYDVEILRARSDPDQPTDLFRIPRPKGARRVGEADLFELFEEGASGR